MNRLRLIVAVSLITVSQVSVANVWDDFWKTKDQQAAQALDQHHPEKAAELFINPNWRAVAQYRQGDYQQSLLHFSAMDSATGFYNAGNAAAHLHQYPEAIAYYDKALEQQPDFVEAKENKAIIEKLLKEQKQQNQENKQDKQDQQQDKNDQEDQKSQQGQQNQDDQNGQDGQDGRQQDSSQSQEQRDQQKANAEQANDENNQQAGADKANQDKQSSSQNEQENQSESEEESAKQNLQQQLDSSSDNRDETDQQSQQGSQIQQSTDSGKKATMQWLHQIPDDPGGLLRQKFLREHDRYNSL